MTAKRPSDPTGAAATSSTDGWTDTARLGAWWLPTLAAAVLCLPIAAAVAEIPRAGDHPPIFFFLVGSYDASAAILGVALMAVAAVVVTLPSEERLVSTVIAVGRRPGRLAALGLLACAVGSAWGYRATPLAMDEVAPEYQARVFAGGALSGFVAPALADRALPFAGLFFDVSASGRVVSRYWPGMAALLTPFEIVHVPWAANAVVTAATLLLVARLARGGDPPSDERVGWALLLTVASPVVLISGASFYSMPAHLLATLVFVALLQRGALWSDVLAAQVGSFALALHNPVPHALVAAAVVASLRLPPWRVARLAAAYVPLSGLLVVGWPLFREAIIQPVTPPLPDAAWSVSNILTLPGARLILKRTLALAKLDLWAAPGLLALAVVGWRSWRSGSRPPSAIVAVWNAFVTLFVFHLFVRFDQGHGWGYRYVHPAWAALPLVAAAFLVSPEGARWRRLALASIVAGLVLLPVRLWQVRTFVDGQLAQIPTGAPCPDGQRELVLVDVDHTYFGIDLVRNDPLFEGPRLMFASHGDRAADAAWVGEHFPGAALVTDTRTGERWCAR